MNYTKNDFMFAIELPTLDNTLETVGVLKTCTLTFNEIVDAYHDKHRSEWDKLGLVDFSLDNDLMLEVIYHAGAL